MREVYGASKKTFNVTYTVDGVEKNARRFVDGFAKGVAHESKVGYASLTQFIKEEALKDIQLMKDGNVKEVVWHFYKSAVTGKAGPSGPLEKFLKENGIKVMIEI